MTLFSNSLILIIGIASCFARIFEINNLTEAGGILTTDYSLISNPILLGLILIIILSCTILIFTSSNKYFDNTQNKGLFLCFVAGLLLIISSVTDILGTTTPDIYIYFMIAGGIGLCLSSIIEYKNHISNIIFVILICIFCIGLCLNIIIFDVYSISNTTFLHNGIFAITNLLFFACLFRSYYIPTNISSRMLYFAGMLNFILINVVHTSLLVNSLINNDFTLTTILHQLSFVFLGLFCYYTAVTISKPAEYAVSPNELTDEDAVSSYDVNIENSDYTEDDVLSFFSNPLDEKHKQESQNNIAISSFLEPITQDEEVEVENEIIQEIEEIIEEKEEQEIENQFFKISDLFSEEKEIEVVEPTLLIQPVTEEIVTPLPVEHTEPEVEDMQQAAKQVTDFIEQKPRLTDSTKQDDINDILESIRKLRDEKH